MNGQIDLTQQVIKWIIRALGITFCILVAAEFRGMHEKIEVQEKQILILKQSNELLRRRPESVEKLESMLERIRKKFSDPKRKTNELFLLYLKDQKKFSEKLDEMRREISKRRAQWKLQEKAKSKRINDVSSLAQCEV